MSAHLPLVVQCRDDHQQQDGEKARVALMKVGLRSAPMGTLAVCSLAVLRIRTTALGLDEADGERDELVALADALENKLTVIQQVTKE